MFFIILVFCFEHGIAPMLPLYVTGNTLVDNRYRYIINQHTVYERQSIKMRFPRQYHLLPRLLNMLNAYSLTTIFIQYPQSGTRVIEVI
jgi:hypothetical protein